MVGADSAEDVHIGPTTWAVGETCSAGAVSGSPVVGVGLGIVIGVGVAEGPEVKVRVVRAKGVDGESVESGGDVGLATGLQAAIRTHKPIKAR
jgi:hypothetical protein